MNKLLYCVVFLLLCHSLSFAQDYSTKSTSLTIYQNNFATVQQTLELKLNESPSLFKYQIPSINVISSSIFLTYDGEILEQSISAPRTPFDNWSETSIGKEVTIVSPNGQTFKGKVAKFDDELIVTTNEGNSIFLKDLEGFTIIFNNYQPELFKKPEVHWLLKPKKTGNNLANIVFHTSGINWKTKYFAFLDENKQRMNLFAYANINNQSGIDFENVNLKIVEGELNYQENYTPFRSVAISEASSQPMLSSAKFETEESLFEYYQYKYPQKVTLKNKENKLLQLFATENIPYKKIFVYNLYSYPQLDRKEKPMIYIAFKNSKDNNLGMLLPKGDVDFYQKTGENIEFVGQSSLKTAPVGDESKLFVGDATDLAVEVKNAESVTIGQNRIERRYKVVCHNFKNKDASIEIVYYPDLQSMELIKTNIQPKEKQPMKLVFEVPIKANSTSELNFIVQVQK